MEIPFASVDLIKELDRMYPEKSPEIGDPERVIWLKAGERRVVRMLTASLQHAEENVLDQKTIRKT